MDGLNLYGKYNNEPAGLLRTVKACNDDTGMESSFNKCAKINFQKGKLRTSHSVVYDAYTVARELEQDKFTNKLGLWHSICNYER